eukprot:m.1194364 g.1194364  ORF g.1194364 m.1194364 type:complete len:433 (-) comp24562_c1_seq6:196-1494(-)
MLDNKFDITSPGVNKLVHRQIRYTFTFCLMLLLFTGLRKNYSQTISSKVQLIPLWSPKCILQDCSRQPRLRVKETSRRAGIRNTNTSQKSTPASGIRDTEPPLENDYENVDSVSDGVCHSPALPPRNGTVIYVNDDIAVGSEPRRFSERIKALVKRCRNAVATSCAGFLKNPVMQCCKSKPLCTEDTLDEHSQQMQSINTGLSIAVNPTLIQRASQISDVETEDDDYYYEPVIQRRPRLSTVFDKPATGAETYDVVTTISSDVIKGNSQAPRLVPRVPVTSTIRSSPRQSQEGNGDRCDVVLDHTYINRGVAQRLRFLEVNSGNEKPKSTSTENSETSSSPSQRGSSRYNTISSEKVIIADVPPSRPRNGNIANGVSRQRARSVTANQSHEEPIYLAPVSKTHNPLVKATPHGDSDHDHVVFAGFDDESGEC